MLPKVVKELEALWYMGPKVDTEEPERFQINFEPCLKENLIDIVDLDLTSDLEPETVVNLRAQNLDQVEAEASAIALHRRWALAVDENKTRRLLNGRVPIATTPDLLKWWADKAAPEAQVLKMALARIEMYASYSPGKSHHLHEWWRSIVDC